MKRTFSESRGNMVISLYIGDGKVAESLSIVSTFLTKNYSRAFPFGAHILSRAYPSLLANKVSSTSKGIFLPLCKLTENNNHYCLQWVSLNVHCT